MLWRWLDSYDDLQFCLDDLQIHLLLQLASSQQQHETWRDGSQDVSRTLTLYLLGALQPQHWLYRLSQEIFNHLSLEKL
jgi:hypothetical protein